MVAGEIAAATLYCKDQCYNILQLSTLPSWATLEFRPVRLFVTASITTVTADGLPLEYDAHCLAMLDEDVLFVCFYHVFGFWFPLSSM